MGNRAGVVEPVQSDLYKQDGVNIDAGDVFSRFCARINKATYKISHFVQMYDLSAGNFRGPRGYVYKNLPQGCIETGGMDGVGTKVIVIDAAGMHITSASNLLAMTGMDITRWGGFPLIFMNIFDVRSLGEVGSKTFRYCQKIMRGLGELARRHQYVLLNGETAELGLCVGSENPDAQVMFNWGGAMLGVFHPDKMILGNTLRPGQVIIVFQDVFRSNGISSVRKALAMKYGAEWWNNRQAFQDIQACAAPCAQYDRLLNTAHGWFNGPSFDPLINMHLIVHLSGGAFESKLGSDILKPLGLSAELPNLFTPAEIMQKCAEWRGMSHEECYRTWNGGQGGLVIVDEKDASNFLRMAGRFGVKARRAGRITEQKDYTLRLKSQFPKGKWIEY